MGKEYLRDLPPEEAAKIRKERRQKKAAEEELRAQNKRRALELRREGKTTHEIGDELGFSHVTASRYIRAALADITREPAEEVLALELERLDAMFHPTFAKAKNGILDAVDRCLRIMDRRAKYLGLDKTGTTGTPTDYETLRLQISRAAARIAAAHPNMTADEITLQITREN